MQFLSKYEKISEQIEEQSAWKNTCICNVLGGDEGMLVRKREWLDRWHDDTGVSGALCACHRVQKMRDGGMVWIEGRGTHGLVHSADQEQRRAS
jgi:hypothetical protein